MQLGVFMKKLVLWALLSFNLYAKEEILTTTDNDDNNEVYKLVVKIDESSQSLKELFKDTYLNEKKVSRVTLNPKDLKSKDGVILEKRDKHNVLNLKSDNFDFDRGGRIIIDTLFNAVTGERKLYDLELAKDKTGWKLFNGKSSVSQFHVKVNKKIIIGTIGIKTIIME